MTSFDVHTCVMYLKLAMLSAYSIVLLILASCGSDEVATSTEPVATPPAETQPVESPTTATPGDKPTTAPAMSATTAPAATAKATATSVGDWSNRFCVDPIVVETTLNLRAQPSTDAEVLASIGRSSCELIAAGVDVDNNFQAVIYTTAAGAIEGWVSNDFIQLQNPPTDITAAALLFVDAWQDGADTSQYSYDIGPLPVPIAAGNPVLVDGPDGFGCVLVGDITISCAIALVERDGTEVARMSVGVTQRGVDGNDGEPYFAPDFPDGPTVISFAMISG